MRLFSSYMQTEQCASYRVVHGSAHGGRKGLEVLAAHGRGVHARDRRQGSHRQGAVVKLKKLKYCIIHISVLSGK